VRLTNLAGSLVLSALNAFVFGVALLIGYSGISPWWGALMIWIVSAPLTLIAGTYAIRDLFRGSTRKQAVLAIVCLIPIAILVWRWRFRGI